MSLCSVPAGDMVAMKWVRGQEGGQNPSGAVRFGTRLLVRQGSKPKSCAEAVTGLGSVYRNTAALTQANSRPSALADTAGGHEQGRQRLALPQRWYPTALGPDGFPGSSCPPGSPERGGQFRARKSSSPGPGARGQVFPPPSMEVGRQVAQKDKGTTWGSGQWEKLVSGR